MATTDEEILDSIPDEAITSTLAWIMKQLSDQKAFGLQSNEGDVLPLKLGEATMTPMGHAEFSVTAMLGEESRTWKVRITADEQAF